MNGTDIRNARKAAHVNQSDLAEALGLLHRTSLTDVESNAIEVTDAYVLKALGCISGIVAQRQHETPEQAA